MRLSIKVVQICDYCPDMTPELNESVKNCYEVPAAWKGLRKHAQFTCFKCGKVQNTDLSLEQGLLGIHANMFEILSNNVPIRVEDEKQLLAFSEQLGEIRDEIEIRKREKEKKS